MKKMLDKTVFETSISVLPFVKRWSLLCCLGIFFVSISFAQSPYVEVSMNDERQDAALLKSLTGKLQTRDTTLVRKRLARFMDNLRIVGYADASVDFFSIKNDTILLQVYRGPYYELTSLELDSLPPEARLALNKETLPRPFNRQRLQETLNDILYDFQGKGFPFAAFASPETKFEANGIDSVIVAQSYQFDAGEKVVIDSIRLTGKRREPDYLLHRIMRIRPGDVYRQERIDDIPRVLNNTPYYERTPSPRIRYKLDGTAILEVQTRRQRAGKFDLLLGLLPPDDPTQGKFRITGLVDAVFVSALEMGERIEFTFKQLSATSQIINLSYEQPYPGGLPISPAFYFNLQKQEERFLNRSLGLSGRYSFSPQLQGEIFYRNRQTALLDTNLARGAGGINLPEVMSGADRRVGLRLQFEKLDYRLNPRKGFVGSVEVGTGQRSTRPDVRLGDEARAVLEAQQTVQEVDLSVSVFIPTGKRTTVRLRNETYLLAQSQYFQNDQRQIGGGRSIRGFEDNQFFADRYAFFSAEYRLLLDQNAHMLAFTDYAYLNNRVDNSILRPWSFGLGLQIDTGAPGLLSLVYGIGSVADGPFRPARGKLHIGLVNNF
ncbi:MAG: POTRA domain-containing protein [Bacteroidia bacterium]